MKYRRKRNVRRKRAYRRVAKARRRMSLVRKRVGVSRKFRRRRINKLKFTNVFTPLRRLVKVRYVQTLVPGGNLFDVAGAGVPYDSYWRCNQLNSPSGNVAPGGYPNHQPMLYDQLGLFHQRNIVLGSKIHCQCRFYAQNYEAMNDLPPMIMIMYRSETGVLPTYNSWDHLFEMSRIDPNLKAVEFKPSGSNVGNVFNFFHTWSIRKQASVKDIRDNLDDYGAAFNGILNAADAVPVKRWFYFCRLVPKTSNVAADVSTFYRVEMVFKLTYVAMCYERNNNITQS